MEENSQSARTIELSHDIRQVEADLVIAQKRNSRGSAFLAAGPIMLAVVIVFASIPKLGQHPVSIAVMWIAGLAGFLLLVKGVHYKAAPGGSFKAPLDSKGEPKGPPTFELLEIRPRWKKWELELKLAKLRDLRKMSASTTAIDVDKRRAAYKDDAFYDVQRFRLESKAYRRTSNALQAILIVGSFITTGTAGVGLFERGFQWITVATSFAVGIASGFLGYFKYRERSAYLQQTADSIENEWEAFELGIGRYKHTKDTENKALADFVEEVYRLKSDQKKRQQNLDQPSDEKISSPEIAD